MKTEEEKKGEEEGEMTSICNSAVLGRGGGSEGRGRRGRRHTLSGEGMDIAEQRRRAKK